jgi:hypothetical protein
LSHNAKTTWACATRTITIGKRDKQPNNLVDIVDKSRVLITIVDDVAVETNTVRTILPTITMRKKIQNRSSKVRSKGPYLEKFNLATSPLMPGRRYIRRMKGRISLIVDDAIFIETETNRKMATRTLSYYIKTLYFYWKLHT